MPERVNFERTWRLGLLVLLLALAGLSFDRARRGRYDFHHFYLEAQHVWQHGALHPQMAHSRSDEERQLPFYLPVVPLMLAPLAALGRVGAALVWTAAQVAALGVSLRILRGWCADRGLDGPAILGTATLLALPALVEAARFNQLSFFVLALVLAGVDAMDRARPGRAGALLGLATILKLLPAIFLPWLLLKRRWTAAATLTVTVLAVGLLPPLAGFGPARTWEYHRQWWQHNVRGDSASGLLKADLPDHFVDRRNQSIFQVLARWTWPEHRFRIPWQPLHLDARTCVLAGYVVTALLGAGLLWKTRHPWSRLSAAQRHVEVACYALGMLAFSPLVRQYYLVWALPALVMLARAAGDPDDARQRRLGWTGLGVWTIGMLAWIWPLTRLLGVHLLMLVVLGILLLFGSSHLCMACSNEGERRPSAEAVRGSHSEPPGPKFTRRASSQ